VSASSRLPAIGQLETECCRICSCQGMQYHGPTPKTAVSAWVRLACLACMMVWPRARYSITKLRLSTLAMLSAWLAIWLLSRSSAALYRSISEFVTPNCCSRRTSWTATCCTRQGPGIRPHAC
jgi:hypothetical protein